MERRPGDWDCSQCEHMNFASRESCRSCSAAKPVQGLGGLGVHPGESPEPRREASGTNSRPGDWDCPVCQHMNFAKRDACRSCGTLKESINGIPQLPGGKYTPDWACMMCNYNNFGRNKSCIKCTNPRPTISRFGGSKAAVHTDWNCACGELVFGSRFACRNCGTPRPVVQQYAPASVYPSYALPRPYERPPEYLMGSMATRHLAPSPQMKPGDWLCTCGEHVFGTKDACRKCGALKPQPSQAFLNSQSQSVDTRPPDWPCECGFRNFGTRTECHKCKRPKPN